MLLPLHSLLDEYIPFIQQLHLEFWLSLFSVFVIGLYIEGVGKPNDGSSFLSKLVFEFWNFLPSNGDIVCTNGQCFAASLCCIIADGLMRSYSERTKSHSGYRRLLVMRSLYSEGRYGTSNWARKSSKENEICCFYVLCQCSADDHLKDPSDLSPFFKKNS
jgi:hypothetical protein